MTMVEQFRTERVPTARLHPAPHNPRLIRDARFEQLKRSLAADPEMLEARPIIALPSGEVVAGNMRLRAALALGWDVVPCITVDLDARRAREWMLKDNNAWGEWQEDDLAALVYDLGRQGTELDLLGFDDGELERLVSLSGGGPDIPIPDDSREYDEDIPTQHECPKCGYAWN